MESENSRTYNETAVQVESLNGTSSNKAISDMTLEEHKYFMPVDLGAESNEKGSPLQDTRPSDGPISSHHLCRICATGTDYLIPIFQGEGLQNQFSHKINKYLPIQVSEKDSLPLQVCYQCGATLLAWHKLAIECISAQDRLLQFQKTLQLEQRVISNEPSDDSRNGIDYSVIGASVDRDAVRETISNEASINDPTRSGYTRASFKLLLERLQTFWQPCKRYRIECKTMPKANSSESEPLWIAVSNSTLHESDGSESESDTSRQDFNEEKAKSTNESEDAARVIQAKSKRLNSCLVSKEQRASKESCEHVKMLPTELYQCTECRKCFKLKDSYIRHMRIHTDERPFTCHICGKQFRVSGGLSRHLKDVHAKVKKFVCDICGRSFASKATKEDHRRTHTGERPYVCDSCGKSFKSKACLYTHCKLHTDQYPHPCTQCKKKFRRRQEMLAHLTTHTGEKNYACDVCSKRFRVKSELVRHKLVHSESKPFVCVNCGLAFRQKRYLNNHIRSRHIDNSQTY